MPVILTPEEIRFQAKVLHPDAARDLLDALADQAERLRTFRQTLLNRAENCERRAAEEGWPLATRAISDAQASGLRQALKEFDRLLPEVRA